VYQPLLYPIRVQLSDKQAWVTAITLESEKVSYHCKLDSGKEETISAGLVRFI